MAANALLTYSSLRGCSYAVTSNTQASIGIGACLDSAGLAAVRVASAIPLDITAAGAGGLDTGSEAISTYYYPYVIWGTAGVNGVLSASSTTPTLPPGYTYFRRVGSVYNNVSGNLVQGTSYGDSDRIFKYAGGGLGSGAVSIATGSIACAALWPPTAYHLLGGISVDIGVMAAGNFGYYTVAMNSGFLWTIGIQVDATSAGMIRQFRAPSDLIVNPGGTRLLTITQTGGTGSANFNVGAYGFREYL